MHPPDTARPRLLFISPGTVGQTRREPAQPPLPRRDPAPPLLGGQVEQERAVPGGERWELLQPERWVKTLFSLPGSWGIKARQGGGRVSAAPSPPGPFACRSQPRGGQAAQPPACTSRPYKGHSAGDLLQGEGRGAAENFPSPGEAAAGKSPQRLMQESKQQRRGRLSTGARKIASPQRRRSPPKPAPLPP